VQGIENLRQYVLWLMQIIATSVNSFPTSLSFSNRYPKATNKELQELVQNYNTHKEEVEAYVGRYEYT
jgi:hypothetical protein